jgi:hypothetical protein
MAKESFWARYLFSPTSLHSTSPLYVTALEVYDKALTTSCYHD